MLGERCDVQSVQTNSQKDDRADDRGSRQCQWEAHLPQGPGTYQAEEASANHPLPGSFGAQNGLRTGMMIFTKEEGCGQGEKRRPGVWDGAEGMSSHAQQRAVQTRSARRSRHQGWARGARPPRSLCSISWLFSFLEFGAWQQHGVLSRWLSKGTGKQSGGPGELQETLSS